MTQRRVVRVQKYQTGISNVARDLERSAMLPGYRISKTGKRYYEARKNRSDMKGKKT